MHKVVICISSRRTRLWKKLLELISDLYVVHVEVVGHSVYRGAYTWISRRDVNYFGTDYRSLRPTAIDVVVLSEFCTLYSIFTWIQPSEQGSFPSLSVDLWFKKYPLIAYRDQPLMSWNNKMNKKKICAGICTYNKHSQKWDSTMFCNFHTFCNLKF